MELRSVYLGLTASADRTSPAFNSVPAAFNPVATRAIGKNVRIVIASLNTWPGVSARFL